MRLIESLHCALTAAVFCGFVEPAKRAKASRPGQARAALVSNAGHRIDRKADLRTRRFDLLPPATRACQLAKRLPAGCAHSRGRHAAAHLVGFH